MQMVISHADFLLSMFENFTAEERPPEWMWPFDDEMGPALDAAIEERRKKYGGGSDEPDLPDLERNELVRFARR